MSRWEHQEKSVNLMMVDGDCSWNEHNNDIIIIINNS